MSCQLPVGWMGEKEPVGRQAVDRVPLPQHPAGLIQVGRRQEQDHIGVWHQRLSGTREQSVILEDRMARSKVDDAPMMLRQGTLHGVNLETFPVTIDPGETLTLRDLLLLCLAP